MLQSPPVRRALSSRLKLRHLRKVRVRRKDADISYTVKMQMGRIKVIKGCRVMMTGIRKKNCVYSLEAKVMTLMYKSMEQEKVHLGIKVGVNIMLTGVPGQEGAEGNVAEKKKVKESMEANLGKLLKYNAWSTSWSPIRGSSTRKKC
ncbi:hypothetical protein Tco_1411828 [Tanacetum coccineum]